MKALRFPGYYHIAWHLAAKEGVPLDPQTLKQHRYQPTRYNVPVYSWGETYYAYGPRRPASHYERGQDWRHVPSAYDPKVKIWELES